MTFGGSRSTSGARPSFAAAPAKPLALPSLCPPSLQRGTPVDRAGSGNCGQEALHAQAYLHLSVLPLAFFFQLPPPPRLQLDPPRRFGLERFVRSGHSGWTLAGALTHPPQPAPNCKEPRRASAHPPEVPLGPQGRATVSQAKLASSPMSQRGLP